MIINIEQIGGIVMVEGIKVAQQVRYQWIDIDSIPKCIEESPLLLFGAGKGTEEFLDYLHFAGSTSPVIAIADNDTTMWGKRLNEIPIIEPSRIPDLLSKNEHLKVIVTTVSGREMVTIQLESMNLIEGIHFYKIGCFPALAMNNFQTLLQMDVKYHFMNENSHILHVGPGGFLGFECALAACNFYVKSIDAYDFSMRYPIIDTAMNRYRDCRKPFLSIATSFGYDKSQIEQAWDNLFIKKQCGYYLDTPLIEYSYPFRFSQLPFEDEMFDIVISFAVLEHVRHPDTVVSEINRVLKPGGVSLNEIVTRDHRSFSAVESYSPVSYMQYSSDEWEKINKNKFYQNRLIPYHWRKKFIEKGFDIIDSQILDYYEIPTDEYQEFDRAFKILPEQYLKEINCLLCCRK